MTFGRVSPITPHDMNSVDAEVKVVYFIHCRMSSVFMGYKTTTDPFVLRGTVQMDITGTVASGETTIDTSLDTLNREVLIIHEVDIQHGDLPRDAMEGLLNGTALNQFVIRDTVQSESGFKNLDDVEYIAGKDLQFSGRLGTAPGAGVGFVFDQKNPDSTDMPSKDKAPLAIVTSSNIVLRTDFASSITISTSEQYQSFFRIHAQRAKADADTYAALVTGLL